MKKISEMIILCGSIITVIGVIAIRNDWDEYRIKKIEEQTKVNTVHIHSGEKDGSTLVMVYPDGTSVELTGSIEVMPRDGKWYVEFTEK